MKKLFLSILCLLTLTLPAWAQQQVPINSGVAVADVAHNSAFKIFVNQAVSSFSFTSSTGPISGGLVVLVNFSQDATGHSVTFSNITGPCSVSSTANAVTICQFTYDDSSNTWFGVSGGSSSGGNPAGATNALQYNLAGVFGAIAPPTTNGLYQCGYNVTASAAVAPTCPQSGLGGRSITGAATTDTVAFSDVNSVINHDKAATGAVNETLPTATTLTNAAFAYKYCNHSAQTDTITPTTWTIQAGNAVAGATLSVPSGVCYFIHVDPNSATNWLADASNVAATGTTTIASGTAALGTTAIASGACATVVTVAATGVATTDAITANPNTDPTAVTGYGPSASGSLYIWKYPTANNVNFKVCNNTSGSITPAALTLNWRVTR